MTNSKTVYFNFKQSGDILFQPHWSQPWHIVWGITYEEAIKRLRLRPTIKAKFPTVCGKEYTYSVESVIVQTPIKKRKCCEACIIEGLSREPRKYKAEWDDGLPF